jgi:hypothetical protein
VIAAGEEKQRNSATALAVHGMRGALGEMVSQGPLCSRRSATGRLPSKMSHWGPIRTRYQRHPLTRKPGKDSSAMSNTYHDASHG